MGNAAALAWAWHGARTAFPAGWPHMSAVLQLWAFISAKNTAIGLE